ncbi:MAG: hypothetical protein KDC38_20015, partial [Planctomycetes bacterium]|nr:hypothetical protein [Planctomycetota bacterium]
IVVTSADYYDPQLGPYPIYAFRPDGTLKEGWPVTPAAGYAAMLTVSLADLDGDYQCELIGAGLGLGGEMFVLRLDGTSVLGPIYDTAMSRPAIGNLDADEDLELVFPSLGIAVWDLDTGPGPAAWIPSGGLYQGFVGVAIADVNGDGIAEISARSKFDLAQHCWNAALEPLPGWPKSIDDVTDNGRQPTAIEDLDADGDIDLVFNNGWAVEVWEFPNPTGPTRVDWGHWCHDPGRTNNYHHGKPVLPRYLRGDTNSDGTIDFADVFVQLDYVTGADPDHPCPPRLDFDDDGVIDLCDIIDQLDYLFLGGPPPAAPFPECRLHGDNAWPCALEACP